MSPSDEDDDDLRTDLDDALRFLHKLMMQTKRAVMQHKAMVDALAEQLPVDAAAVQKRLEPIQKHELVRIQDHVHLRIYENVDKYDVVEPEIDCAARIHICKGRCCKMYFSLSRQDLREHVVQWDHANPYFIRHGADGFCVHSSKETRFCTVYENRPAICRAYSCKNDKRIWKDFDKMIPQELQEGPEPTDEGASPALRKQLR
jgi:Fe-S-cluster containining protein